MPCDAKDIVSTLLEALPSTQRDYCQIPMQTSDESWPVTRWYACRKFHAKGIQLFVAVARHTTPRDNARQLRTGVRSTRIPDLNRYSIKSLTLSAKKDRACAAGSDILVLKRAVPIVRYNKVHDGRTYFARSSCLESISRANILYSLIPGKKIMCAAMFQVSGQRGEACRAAWRRRYDRARQRTVELDGSEGPRRNNVRAVSMLLFGQISAWTPSQPWSDVASQDVLYGFFSSILVG